ncbi:response regulator transcription factor [Rhizobium sp. GCM10022189]|uniref:response regulator transcription factor n=1 Tax=Rhizobium sp. GCM10022189 TaxID=3252654 RepID=UPI003614C9C7
MPNRTELPGIARVFIVDKDEETRLSLLKLFRFANIDARSYATAAELLDSVDLRAPGCLLLDTYIDGFDVQRRLAAQDFSLPVVFMTRNATIPMAVDAMKRGACDFLLKPLDDFAVLAAVRSAINRDLAARALAAERDLTQRLIEMLTPREREVMMYVAKGDLNKQIAHRLNVSEMMVKIHRGRMMKKMKANSLVQLIKKLELVYAKSTYW